MKLYVREYCACLAIVLLFLFISKLPVYGESSVTNSENILKSVRACFILYDVKSDKIVERYGAEHCAERDEHISP